MKKYAITDLFKTTWRELSDGEFYKVLELSTQCKQAMKADDYNQIGFINIDILKTLRKNKAVVSKITVEQVVDCVNDLTFLHEPWYFFPVAKISMGDKEYSCPLDGMANATFKQFMDADSCFTKFLVMQQINAPDKAIARTLRELASVLYNTDTLVESLPLESCLLIMHTFANIRQSIIARCPTLFNVSTTDEQEPAEEAKVIYSGEMWMNVLFDLSETPAYQGVENAKRANCLEALDYLEKKSIDNYAAKKRQQQHA